ncbi:MAG: PAS domain S-box protein [Myxococcales bacterium]|nr:PAS domain S-box protein [Myxococcales bacterium]
MNDRGDITEHPPGEGPSPRADAALQESLEALLFENERLKSQVRDLQAMADDFRLLAEHAPDIIGRLDRQLRHLYVNPVIETVTGRKRSDFLGRSNRELGMPDHLCDLWERELHRCIALGRASEMEFDFPTPNGPKTFETRMVPELGADGNARSVLVVARDISVLKRIERDLEQKAAILEATLESLEDGFIALDDRLLTVYANRRATELFGLASTVVGLPFSEVLEDFRGSELERRLMESLRSGRPDHFSMYLKAHGRWYAIGLHPHQGGISAYFSERPGADAPADVPTPNERPLEGHLRADRLRALCGLRRRAHARRSTTSSRASSGSPSSRWMPANRTPPACKRS